MQKFLFIIFFLLNFCLFAQPGFFWAKQQVVGTYYCMSGGITIDDYGNIYTTGGFTDTADFDPDSSIYNLIAHGDGSYDIFISKWDSIGNLIWAKSMGGKKRDQALSLALDKQGNLYITGYFRDTADFDPGPGVFNLISAGGEDIFICKLDSSGNLVWAKSMGGTDGYYERGVSITIDNKNTVCLTGTFGGTCDFDPGNGVFNLTEISGGGDAFICKLDSSGNFLWVTQLGGAKQEGGNSITVDADNNIYATGRWDTIGWNDVFICKLDASGNLFWLKHLAGVNANSLTLDDNKNIYLTGGPGIFVCKLDSLGNVIWNKGGGYGYGRSIVVDRKGNLHVLGIFSGTVDFDFGPGEYFLSSPGNNDDNATFVIELDSKYGNFICAGKLDGPGYIGRYYASAWGSQIAIDNEENLFASGRFSITADLNPGPDVFNLNANGRQALFVTKFSSCAISSGENSLVTDIYSFDIYPNPTKQSITVTNLFSNSEIKIYNSLGELVVSTRTEHSRSVAEPKVFQSSIHEKQFTINLSNQPSGVYFIEITSGEERIVKKIILH